MIFGVEIINLLLYCAQQLGIALGLGAQTIMLVAYVHAMRDGKVDDEEAQFLRATRRTLWVALALVLSSGAIITVLHLLAGQAGTILTPAYLFKLALIAAVVALTAMLHALPETFAEGLLGGAWYALFVVHILAPIASWGNLLTLLAVWMIGFNLLWYVIAFSTRERGAKTQPAAKSSEKEILEKSVKEKPAPPPQALPVQFQPIKLERAPQPQAAAAPQPELPAAVLVPVSPPAPVPIKLDAASAVARQAAPAELVEKLPAAKTTDTPFLPQVPPLQPIPTIPPTPGAPAQTNAPVGPRIVTDAQGAKAPPALQKAEELPAAPSVPPEIKLGLNVMPKSPDQLPQ